MSSQLKRTARCSFYRAVVSKRLPSERAVSDGSQPLSNPGAALQFSRPKSRALSYGFTELIRPASMSRTTRRRASQCFRRTKAALPGALLTTKAAGRQPAAAALAAGRFVGGRVRLGDQVVRQASPATRSSSSRAAQAPVRSETIVTLQSRSSRRPSSPSRSTTRRWRGRRLEVWAGGRRGRARQGEDQRTAFEKIGARLEQLSKRPLRDLAEGSTVNDQPARAKGASGRPRATFRAIRSSSSPLRRCLTAPGDREASRREDQGPIPGVRRVVDAPRIGGEPRGAGRPRPAVRRRRRREAQRRSVGAARSTSKPTDDR